MVPVSTSLVKPHANISASPTGNHDPYDSGWQTLDRLFQIGLIRHLDFMLGGHMFTILAVVLRLEAPGAYPMLLGRWLRTTNIKQHWQCNMISFR